MKNRVAAIIVAAGQSTRYGSPKVLESIGGVPVVVRSLSAFLALDQIDEFVIVTRDDLLQQVNAAIRPIIDSRPLTLVSGGARRQDSVAAGLAAVPEATVVVVHDGARPLVTAGAIIRSIDAVLDGADAAVSAVPVSDTLKRQTGEVVETVDRSGIWRAQTPQAFRARVLNKALTDAAADGIDVTDESALIEQSGGRVVLVKGDERNLKLTVPGDREILEALVAMHSRPSLTRTGVGYDVHRLVEGRPLYLGGVPIPFDRGLDGHSDADVVLHAICDAILGACAMGDIGTHFPPGDPRFKDINSLILLTQVVELVSARDFVVEHLDTMLIAEAPRVGPFVDDMRKAIADACRLPVGSVSIKATTNEGLGFAGRQEGIAAMATATVTGPR